MGGVGRDRKKGHASPKTKTEVKLTLLRGYHQKLAKRGEKGKPREIYFHRKGKRFISIYRGCPTTITE